MTGIVIHIGFSKTGTTTLQRAVFQNHSQLYYLGKIQKSEHERQCVTADTFDFLKPLLWKTDQPYDVEAERKFFEETLTPRVGPGQTILGSWEGLGQQGISSFEASIGRLKDVCGQCKVMMSLRNPISRLPSLYLQHLRGNQKQLVEEFITFEEWLAAREEQLGGLREIFQYRDYVETAIDVLGKENVGVFLYEEFDSDPEKYQRDVSDFLGIDAQEFIDLAKGQRHHTRLFASQVNQMEEKNSSFIGRLLWRFSSVEKKKKAIGFADDEGIIKPAVASDVPASVDLSPEISERIHDAARADDHWLVDNLQLALDKYGYPL
tara:strand:- start:873 stop:1835 length:963 start_codon:yes stop_codon:yes gene_type:complete